MKRLLGALFVLALLGGAVWIGVFSSADTSLPPGAGTAPEDGQLDCDGGDGMVTHIDAAAIYASDDEALAAAIAYQGWDLEPEDFPAVEQGRNATTYAYAVDAETKITISAERIGEKWAVSTIEECASNAG